MFLLYTDASGNPNPDPQNDVYAMIGLCVHEGTWFALERRFQGLKARFQFTGIPFELHAKDFCIDFPEQRRVGDFNSLDYTTRRAEVLKIRSVRLKKESNKKKKTNLRKKYACTDPFIHLTRKERTTLYESALELVGDHEGLRLFGEVVDKPHLFRQQNISLAIEHSFTAGRNTI